jgi:bacillaene synthase trans-acting acyltransferase
MFSGQGSQYYQMGRELYESHAQFRFWMDHCNEIVQPIIKTSLIDVLYRGKGKSEPFDNILYSNPALLCIEYSLFNVLKEMDIHPDLLMGYSLGELTASVISGAISLEDGMQLVVDIARLAEEKTQKAEMLAIVGSTKLMIEFSEIFQDCWLTGINFQENFVVCGLPHSIQHLQGVLNRMNITSQRLPVKYGFHTNLINPIEKEFKQLVSKIRLLPNRIPVVSSLKTEVIHELDEDYFWGVIRYAVNFEQAVNKLLQKNEYIFIDAGPSGTLATCVKYILSPNSRSISLPTINQFGRDLISIEKLKSSLHSVAY